MQDKHKKFDKKNWNQGVKKGFGALEDDDDDIEPEWNSFDPEKETGSFFGREIPDEAQLRTKY